MNDTALQSIALLAETHVKGCNSAAYNRLNVVENVAIHSQTNLLQKKLCTNPNLHGLVGGEKESQREEAFRIS